MRYHLFTTYFDTPYVLDHGYESHKIELCEFRFNHPPMPTLMKYDNMRNSRINLVEYITQVTPNYTNSNKDKYLELLATIQAYKNLDENHVSIPMIHHIYRIKLDYEIWEPMKDRVLRAYSTSVLTKDFKLLANTYISEDNRTHNRFYTKMNDTFLLKIHEINGKGYVRLKLNKINVYYDISLGPIPISNCIDHCHENALWIDPHHQSTWSEIEASCIKIYDREYNDLIFSGIKDNDRINLDITLISNNIVVVNKLDEINNILTSIAPEP